MTSAEAYARLRGLGVPVVETAEAAAALGVRGDTAHKILRRLADAGLVAHLFHGLWATEVTVDPLLLPDHLTAPLPSYVSLQTALYHHGLISQIPAVVYAVTLGRTRRLRAGAATFSMHHVAPEVFGGFEVGPTGVKLATPEKAVFDVLYLSGKRTRQFSTLPELELPRGFQWPAVQSWLERVRSRRDRTIIERGSAQWRARAGRGTSLGSKRMPKIPREERDATAGLEPRTRSSNKPTRLKARRKTRSPTES